MSQGLQVWSVHDPESCLIIRTETSVKAPTSALRCSQGCPSPGLQVAPYFSEASMLSLVRDFPRRAFYFYMVSHQRAFLQVEQEMLIHL